MAVGCRREGDRQLQRLEDREDATQLGRALASLELGEPLATDVGAISEITPLTTEAEMTQAGAGVDEGLELRPDKTTTTVAFAPVPDVIALP